MCRQSRPPLLLTRPAPAAARFAAEVEARFGPRFAPLISPLMAPRFFAPDLPPKAGEQVIFTSETGVEALSRLTEIRGHAICVGPRTALAATQAGWRAEVVGGDAEGLVADLTAHPRSGAWLHARGREAAGQMAARARTGGMTIAEAVVYAQEPQAISAEGAALLAGASPVILPIFSPRSGAILREVAGPIRAPLWIVAISQAAADVMAPLAPARLTIAPTPDGEGMLQALAALINL